jgi:hypothetical protein
MKALRPLLLCWVAGVLALASVSAADVKAIKLKIHNSAKVDIQVFVMDFISNKPDEQKNAVKPGDATTSNVIRDAKGNVDFYIQIRFIDEKKGSYYRCLPVSTSAEGKSELAYSITESTGKSVGGSGVGCKK